VWDPLELSTCGYSKVIFEGPLVQLGRGLITPGSQFAIVGSPVTATIRYGVHPDSFGAITDANLWLLLVSFRQGDGRVIPELIEVDLQTGRESDPLLVYDTATPGFGSPNPSLFFSAESSVLNCRRIHLGPLRKFIM
jgi:hypothetical protein